MGHERHRALLLSGPQHYDPDRPTTVPIRRALEEANGIGIAIVGSYLRDAGIDTRWMAMDPRNRKLSDELYAAIEAFDSVWISARFFDASLAEQAIAIANRLGKPSIVGGYGPSSITKPFEDASTRVISEAELVLPEVIEHLLAGRLEPNYDSRDLPPFDMGNYVFPDRSIFPRSGILKSPFYKTSIEMERGCINKCGWCSPTGIQRVNIVDGKRQPRYRQAVNVIAEIEQMGLKSGDHLFFVDLNLALVPFDELRELFLYFKLKGIRWYIEATIAPFLNDYNKDPENSLLKLMSPLDGDGGCYSFLYGADDLEVRKVKGSYDKESGLLESASETFRRLGIPLNLSVVVGLDHHTYPDSFFRIARLLEKLKCPYAFIHILTPYLGTPLGDEIYKDERVFDNNPTHFNHRRVVHSPANMTPEQLQQGYYWLLGELYDLSKIMEIAKYNVLSGVFRNPTLALIQSGIIWGIETYLTVLELKARGYVDKKIQDDLNNGYKRFCR